jgi:putative toxin-antitoxin system antitoxin component (TIGR02293 family)
VKTKGQRRGRGGSTGASAAADARQTARASAKATAAKSVAGRSAAKPSKVLGAGRAELIVYRPKEGVDAYIRRVGQATPMEIIELERAGVQGTFIKDLSARMRVPTSRFFEVLGLPKATAERKASRGEQVGGSGGRAAIAMAKLLNQAQEIVSESTAEAAQGFDAGEWLGDWIERPQPALGGRRPAELLDTPTGFDVVSRLLGALQSGSYQ